MGKDKNYMAHIIPSKGVCPVCGRPYIYILVKEVSVDTGRRHYIYVVHAKKRGKRGEPPMHYIGTLELFSLIERKFYNLVKVLGVKYGIDFVSMALDTILLSTSDEKQLLMVKDMLEKYVAKVDEQISMLRGAGSR